MKLSRIAWFACLAALTVFLAYSITGYLYLRSHQPPHAPGESWPMDVTSAPPYVAWLVGAYLAALTFVGAFVALFVASAIRRKTLVRRARGLHGPQ